MEKEPYKLGFLLRHLPGQQQHRLPGDLSVVEDKPSHSGKRSSTLWVKGQSSQRIGAQVQELQVGDAGHDFTDLQTIGIVKKKLDGDRKAGKRCRDLVPVLQLVMRQIKLHDVGTEGSNLSLLSSPADPTAAQHQHAGDVQTIWMRMDGRIREKGKVVFEGLEPCSSDSPFMGEP